MKARTYSILVVLLTSLFSFSQVSVNVNLGTPPVWAPADRVETQYYYLPDIDTYYDVPTSNFIYLNRGVWVRSKNLPARYKAYNLRGGRVVYITDYRGNAPYKFHKNHKVKYYKSENRYKGYNNGNGKGKKGGNGKGKKDRD
jgi:hypothetical protein